MSTKYPGGIISKTAPTPSGPYSTDTAPGVWTLEQQAYWQKLGQWPTAGNANPNAFIENLFSTYLYDGTGAAQTITNGINLSANGGMVWFKARSAPYTNRIFDTARGVGATISSNSTGAQFTDTTMLSAFNTTGFSLGFDSSGGVNDSGATFASWTFRKQAKFFDIVTYTGNGTAGRAISHALASTPGFIAVKQTSASGQNWKVWHRAVNGGDAFGVLNTTSAFDTTQAKYIWGNNSAYIAPTSTDFTVSNDDGVNANGATYVAYLFAHDAGGFGLSGTENVISCGSATASVGTWTDVNVGFEPQWVLIKNSTATGSYNPSGSAGSQDWYVIDTMRGATAATGSNTSTVALSANSSIAEYNDVWFGLTSTGFSFKGVTGGSDNFIYIAIRRGPMATPTTGTSVYVPVSQSTSGSYPRPVVTNFPVDFVIMGDRNSTWGYNWSVQDRLRGKADVLFTSATTSENTGALSSFAYNAQFGDGWVTGGTTGIYECFQRAPSFFDVVCYTATVTDPTTMTLNHNLGVVPQMMIKKARQTTSVSNAWRVYHIGLNGGVNPQNAAIILNSSGAETVVTPDWGDTAPTSTQFTVGYVESGYTYVTYLFATCAGVSKVGSYTGTGTTLQVDCGFTGGARFVLIKRTDSTGDWYVWDSARGIVAGNDPYLLLNSTAAEVTGTDYVDTYSAGFEISSTAPSAINASGGTFIFLAIA